MKRFTFTDQSLKAEKGKPYEGRKIKKIAGNRRITMKLEKISQKILRLSLPSPNMYVRNEKGTLFRPVYPSTLHISDPVYHEGKTVNCFGSVVKHIWGIERNADGPYISSDDIAAKIKSLCDLSLIHI